jgi:hypothetical protein
MKSPSVVAAILTAHHPSRYHYRQIAKAQFLVDSPIPYKFVFGDPVRDGDWDCTGVDDDEILHAPGSDDKRYLHIKDQAACRWALDLGAQFLWRAMCDTWWYPERILAAGLEAYDVAGNWPCRLRLGGTFSVPFCYYSAMHGGTGIWLSRKAMKMIVEAEWREDYYDSWPDELDIGYGLKLPKPLWPWDDLWISEVLQGQLAWDDPLRRDPWMPYFAQGLKLYADEDLFQNPDPSRTLSLHDPGRTKKNDDKFDDLMEQIKQKNVAAAQAQRAQEAVSHG